MRRFVSRRKLYIRVGEGIDAYFLEFIPAVGDYFYVCKTVQEEETILSHPYFNNGIITEDTVIKKEERPVPKTEIGKELRAIADAKKAEKEIIDGVEGCSDARAYLRERYPEDNVILRSKKEILEYAESKNLYFPKL